MAKAWIEIKDSTVPSITIKLRVDRNGNSFYRVQRSDRCPARGFKGAPFMSIRVSGYKSVVDALREYLKEYIETNNPEDGVWNGPWTISDGPYEKQGCRYLATWVAVNTGE